MKSITLTALDIGSGSIKGLCVQKDLKSGIIETLSQVELPSFGVRNGEVVKVDDVAQIVAKVKFELEEKADCKIKEVGINIEGNHLFSLSSSGVVSVSRADQKISREDIQRVLRAASAVNLPNNKRIIDTFSKEFTIDGEVVKEVLGLNGIRLEAKVRLAGVFTPVFDNLEKAVSQAGISASDIILGPLATAKAVLTQEQKELGVVVVDIGFGTTSVAVFEKGEMIDFIIFPIGSSNITNDIAIGLRTEIKTAEKIKKDYGTLKLTKKNNREKIKVLDKSLEFSFSFLHKVIESRVNEIFNEVQKNLKKMAGAEPLPAGLIITGGGSKMPGIVEFAKQKFKLPCRIGNIKDIKGVDNETFTTVVGVIMSMIDAEGKIEEIDFSHHHSSSFKKTISKVFKLFLP